MLQASGRMFSVLHKLLRNTVDKKTLNNGKIFPLMPCALCFWCVVLGRHEGNMKGRISPRQLSATEIENEFCNRKEISIVTTCWFLIQYFVTRRCCCLFSPGDCFLRLLSSKHDVMIFMQFNSNDVQNFKMYFLKVFHKFHRYLASLIDYLKCLSRHIPEMDNTLQCQFAFIYN